MTMVCKVVWAIVNSGDGLTPGSWSLLGEVADERKEVRVGVRDEIQRTQRAPIRPSLGICPACFSTELDAPPQQTLISCFSRALQDVVNLNQNPVSGQKRFTSYQTCHRVFSSDSFLSKP